VPKDYYDSLGVSRSASSEEITKAYKKLARLHHPDRNPGDKKAEAKFKEVQTAYDTLSDAEKRKMYDQFGPDGPGMGPGGPGGGFGGAGGMPQVDPEMANEVFSRLFGNAGGGGGFFGGGGTPGGGGKRRKSRTQLEPENLPDIEVDATIPFLDAANGGTIEISVGGRSIGLKVPAGIDDGKKLRVAGQGPNGEDIKVRIRIGEHSYFERKGRDILLEVPVSYAEAFLGGRVEVPTVDGRRVEVKIRAGTSGTTRTRLPGFGVAGGDMYLLFRVVLPKGEPDAKTRELVEELARLHPLDARADVEWKT